MGPFVTDATLNCWADLAAFLTKWECVATLHTYGMCITQVLVRGRISPFSAFVLGMLADEPEVCIASLSTIRTEYLDLSEVAYMQFRIWERVKPKYLWALAHAGMEARMNDGKEGWRDMAYHFRRCLLEAENQVHPR